MRKMIIAAMLAGFATTSAVVVNPTEAHAKKPKKDKAADEEDEFAIVMEETGSEKLDGVFGKATDPIATVADVHTDVAGVKTGLNTSLGLAEGTPFKDGLADLQTKAAGKINVSFAEKGMPKFSAADGVPDNVQASIDGLNASFGKLGDAKDRLVVAGEQFAGVGAEAAEVASEPDQLGLQAMQIPKALSKTTKNTKKLKTGVEVTASLATEIVGLLEDVKSTFASE